MRELSKARVLCASDKIRVFYLTRKGPVEERDPEKRLACLFTASLPLTDEPAIDFKRPHEVKSEDFQPILTRLRYGTKLGIQAGNPSVRVALSLRKYKEKYEMAKEKSKIKQQLSKDEKKVVVAYEGGISGILKLDFALYYSRVLNFMASHAFSLAANAGKFGALPLVTLCLDDILSSEYLKEGLDQREVTQRLVGEYTKRLQSWKSIIETQHNIELETDIYTESGLVVRSDDNRACSCDFCHDKICPVRVSSAVEKLIERGCGAIVNFYIENEGVSQKSYMHYERIERGMLHRTTELGDETLRCNIYFGVRRAFMVIYESPAMS